MQRTGGGMTRAAMLVAMLAVATLSASPGDARARDNAWRQEGAADAVDGAVWERLDAAWNARDAERFSALFTEGVSFAFVDRGEAFAGNAALHRHFAERFPQFPSNLRHLTRAHDTRPLAPGILAVDGRVEILDVGADGNAAPRRLRLFSIFAILVRGDEGWKIDLMRIHQLAADGAPAG